MKDMSDNERNKALHQLLGLLWKTEEGKKWKQAENWCNKYFPTMTQKEINEHFQRFLVKVDEPLNKRWIIMQKQYNLYKGE